MENTTFEKKTAESTWVTYLTPLLNQGMKVSPVRCWASSTSMKYRWHEGTCTKDYSLSTSRC